MGMKDTIKLHELCGYLPYGLKTNKGLFWAICNDNLVKTKLGDGEIIKERIDNIKPLLRPLSEYGFSSIVKGRDSETCFTDRLKLAGAASDPQLLGTLPHSLVQELLRNHVDVYDMIGRGLALNINDYKQELK